MSDDKKCWAVHKLKSPYVSVPLDTSHNIRLHLRAGYTGNMDASTRIVIEALLDVIARQEEVIEKLSDDLEAMDTLISGAYGLAQRIDAVDSKLSDRVDALDDRLSELEVYT